MLDVYFCCGQEFLVCPKLDDMVDFLQTLMARRETARQRLEEARKIVTAAEAELRKWSDAVELEQRATGKSPASYVDDGATAQLLTLTLDSVRRKGDILRAAMRSAKRPLKPSEILKLVKPALSRSSVYYLVNQMKESGELEESGGRFKLRSEKLD
jgi:hypothetical protein